MLRSRRWILLTLLALPGCGYSIRPPYDAQIRTVYVPIMRSFTFRRDLNLQLTERVIKEIELRTPYKVVPKEQGADSTLVGVFMLDMKNTLVENPNNLPRQSTITLSANVKWIDNRPTAEKKEVAFVSVSETVNQTPEIGETAQLANQKAIEKMARQIVGMMETPW